MPRQSDPPVPIQSNYCRHVDLQKLLREAYAKWETLTELEDAACDVRKAKGRRYRDYDRLKETQRRRALIAEAGNRVQALAGTGRWSRHSTVTMRLSVVLSLREVRYGVTPSHCPTPVHQPPTLPLGGPHGPCGQPWLSEAMVEVLNATCNPPTLRMNP